MSHSFCIITAGKRIELIKTVIKSIHYQRIPNYEIIIVGDYHSESGITYIESKELASTGRIGEMRNIGVAHSRYNNIVILDDDVILSPDWYMKFLSYDRSFDVLTSQIRVPDGGRYWDHATIGGPKGHIILEHFEDDEYVYMTGGGGWVMKKYVAESVKWDNIYGYYEGEDVDFSRRVQALGYKISHNHMMLVYHADSTYTCVGRQVCRRQQGRSQEWILPVYKNMTLIKFIKFLNDLKSKNYYAERADFFRMAVLNGPCRSIMKIIWYFKQKKMGGSLSGINWVPSGDHGFLTTLKKYR